MPEEIINVDGRKFLLSTDRPLTIEQILQTAAEIRRQTPDQLQQLAPLACPSSKVVGQNVTMVSVPQGGILPYTVTFYRGATVVPGTQNPSGTWTAIYSTIPADVGAPVSFSTRVVDNCTTGIPVTDVCSVNIYNALTCTLNGCPATSITPQTVNLSVIPSGGSGTYTYAWLIDTVASGTTSSITPFLNGGTHNVQITVTDAISNQSCVKTCTITVVCATVTTGFTVS